MTVTFETITAAIRGGADTYRKIAETLQVTLDHPDLAADINYMANLHHLIRFVPGCCDNPIEHNHDCRIELL